MWLDRGYRGEEDKGRMSKYYERLFIFPARIL